MLQQLTPPHDSGDIPELCDGPEKPRYDQDYDDDWTNDLPQTDHIRFFRETDWSCSELGPLKDWGPTLRIFTRLLFADSRAACLWWGPHFVAIYNEAYMPLSAEAHPKLMGAAFTDGYPELWEGIKPYFDQARETGVGVDYSSAQSLMVERRGWLEEAFFKGNFVPIGSGPTNKPEGFYNSLFEVTDQSLADRRTTLLNRLASVPDLGTTSVCTHLLETLKTDATDVPLAMLYEVDESLESKTLLLRGHIGLPKGHNLIVDSQDITSNNGLIPDCRRAGLEPSTIDYDERFASISWAGLGSPSKKIAILPITSGLRILGYLIVGTNPHRPFDDACRQFLKDLSRMVSSIIANAVNAEETKRRQQQLETNLAMSDMKLRHLIEHASVGMAHLSIDRRIIWANDRYYALSGHPTEHQQGQYDFFDVFANDDRAKAEKLWEKLRSGVSHVSVDMRLKRLYTSPNGDTEPAQLQLHAFPYREDGKVRSIMACTTDISRLKWAQTFQARLASEAREAKRQQEGFIDVVSHEMRNPLSAIVHCADAITSAVEECRSRLAEIPAPCLEALNDNLASANIIMQCANHQKRIIDDVLTVSKLDFMMLSITPSAVRPAQLIHSIVAIFEAELKSNNISCNVDADQSLRRLAVDYLYLDPSRVTQIFINLLTNAIKFVKTSKTPALSIHYGACRTEPRNLFAKTTFWAMKSKENDDLTSNSEWGNGEPIYLAFTVKDSGIGLKDKEIHKIFERFRQASTKTHVTYGGSGLGLFISKELTEKQGGEIGVSSVLGQGATFGFYVKTRRVDRRPQSLGELLHKNGGESQAPKKLHVLLVEDNLINQQVLGKQLKKAGCVIDVANHGLEALDMLERKVFDVVLMDMEMPVLNGLGAMREVRKRELAGEGLLGHAAEAGYQDETRLPIIAVTANVRQEQIDTAIAAGADRVMQKPFKAAELVAMMQGLMPQTPLTALPPTPAVFDRKGDYFG